MTKRHWIAATAALVGLAACDGGVSTQEVEQAAVDRAREQLGLDRETQLESRVWTGKQHEGELTYCGSVSSAESATAPIPAQRFVARGDPLEFLVFESAHEPMVTSQPDKFASWEQLCAGQRAV